MHKPSLNTILELSTVTGVKPLIDFAMAAIAKQHLAMRACSTNKVRFGAIGVHADTGPSSEPLSLVTTKEPFQHKPSLKTTLP